jgi:hypothetical protein
LVVVDHSRACRSGRGPYAFRSPPHAPARCAIKCEATRDMVTRAIDSLFICFSSGLYFYVVLCACNRARLPPIGPSDLPPAKRLCSKHHGHGEGKPLRPSPHDGLARAEADAEFRRRCSIGPGVWQLVNRGEALSRLWTMTLGSETVQVENGTSAVSSAPLGRRSDGSRSVA